MKSVSYTATQYLSCATCAGEIIICVDPAKTLTGEPFIVGVAASFDSLTDSCGELQYVYGFTYEEGQLLDPESSLVEGDILGVVCKGCLTDYVDAKSANLTLNLPIFANNAAAILGGLTSGKLYRSGGDPDLVCIVH